MNIGDRLFGWLELQVDADKELLHEISSSIDWKNQPSC